MKLSRIIALITAGIAPLFILCGFKSNDPGIFTGLVLVTVAPVYEPLAAMHGGERFPRGAHLRLVQNGVGEPLLKDFAATADADVSFDTKSVLFAGKREAADPWQIFELSLADRSVRKVIASATDAIRPLYLPGKQIVYARSIAHGFQIETAGLDGTSILPLTHMPASALPDAVLPDGRILFESGFPLASGLTAELFLVYTDGSGVESYRCDHGVARWGGRQSASGDVVFTHGNALARFTSPLAVEAKMTAPDAEYSGGIVEMPDGSLLLSARKSASSHYELNLWKPGSPRFSQVFATATEDTVEPALLAPRTPPKRHPSALHAWDYANLLALDVRQSRDGALSSTPTQVRVESLDDSGKPITLGYSNVEPDGSFFIKVPGDRPIRFALLDNKGAVIRAERGYFWGRSGEQRICVGCHAGPEHAPENNVPAVLLRSTNPVDLTIPGKNTAAQSASGGR